MILQVCKQHICPQRWQDKQTAQWQEKSNGALRGAGGKLFDAFFQKKEARLKDVSIVDTSTHGPSRKSRNKFGERKITIDFLGLGARGGIDKNPRDFRKSQTSFVS